MWTSLDFPPLFNSCRPVASLPGTSPFASSLKTAYFLLQLRDSFAPVVSMAVRGILFYLYKTGDGWQHGNASNIFYAWLLLPSWLFRKE